MKNAIVFLTVRPNMQLIRFAEKFNGSIITPYICIDDSNYNVSSMTVNTIKYSYSECMSRGFKNLILPSTLKNQKRPCAWDKAFYHFCIKDTSYDNVYFILMKRYFRTTLVCLKNFYQELGLKPSCSETEIKKAYFTMAKKYHPDSTEKLSS